MKRFLLTAFCALAPCWAQSAALDQRIGGGPGRIGGPGGPGGGGACATFPAQCQVTPTTFNFGRAQMSTTAPPVNTQGTISVTCTRAEQRNLSVTVPFTLKALPPEPNRFMRDRALLYLRYYMFVDPARTRHWGDGTNGTFTFEGTCFLDDRNRACTFVFPLYGRVEGGQVALPGPWLGAVASRLDYSFGACSE